MGHSRMTAVSAPPFRVGEWRVEPGLDEISRGGKRVKLEPRMMRLLCRLAANPGEVVSFSELLDDVWPGVVVSQGSVYQAVANLRRQLGDTEDEPRYIATVTRKGYRLVATVARDEPGTVEARPSPRPPRRLRRWGLALATLAVVLAVAVSLVLRRDGGGETSTPPTLAVLPFSDLSADASNAAFCAGLTDEILNSLARVPALRVIGRTSAMRFGGGSTPVTEIGTALGATHLLEGSVRRNGNRVRVTAQLVDASDGVEVWANSFDRPAADVIRIQMQIAAAVVDALSLQLTPEARERLQRTPTAQVNAYDLYLLGRHQQLRRTPDALDRAVAYQEAAIAADPGFALAHAGLADAQMARYYYAGESLEDTARRVQPAVDAALRLDPELAEAYAAWAVLLMEQWRTDEAIAALKRAIAINSNYGEAYLRLGAAYEYDGRPKEALDAYEQVASLDPLHTQLHVRRCLVLQNVGRYAEAERACERGFELQPDIPNALWARGLNAYAQGRLAEAISHHEAALARAPGRADIRSELTLLYLDVGLPARAATVLAPLRRGGEDDAGMTTARYLLAAGDAAGLRSHLSGLALAGRAPRERADAAFLALALGDGRLAASLAGDSVAPRPALADDFAPGLYRTRWGVCEMCSAALVARSRGDARTAAQLESAARAYMEGVERHGHVWHGLHYLRAGLEAQAGEKDAALASLERAVELGWRRAWLMRADPALQPLRGERKFAELLAAIDAANADSRRALSLGGK